MNENYIGTGLVAAGQYAMDAKEAYSNRTIGENIDTRITHLQGEIARLQGVKAQLESGTSLLNVRIEDLRQAMNY